MAKSDMTTLDRPMGDQNILQLDQWLERSVLEEAGSLPVEQRDAERVIVRPEERWQKEAACLGLPTALFYSTREEDSAMARALCADCLVREKCLQTGTEYLEPGIWGGLSQEERLQRVEEKRRQQVEQQRRQHAEEEAPTPRGSLAKGELLKRLEDLKKDPEHWRRLVHYESSNGAATKASRLRRGHDQRPQGRWKFKAEADGNGGSDLWAFYGGSDEGVKADSCRNRTAGCRSDALMKEDKPITVVEARLSVLASDALTQNPKKPEQLEFNAELQRQQTALLFCDLSASSSLFDVVEVETAIACMVEYVEGQTAIVHQSGGTIEKHLGDGAMFRFNVSLPNGEHHVNRVAETALRMQESFEALKTSWMTKGWNVAPIYSRMGIACGDVYEVAISSERLPALALMGRPIVRAAHSCGAAPRDRNVIWIDEETQKQLSEEFAVHPVIDQDKKLRFDAYELIGRRPSRTVW